MSLISPLLLAFFTVEILMYIIKCNVTILQGYRVPMQRLQSACSASELALPR